MNKQLALIFAVCHLFFLAAMPLAYAQTDEAVDNLAQGCFAIKSASSGNYLRQSGNNFSFSGSSGDADRFSFKPTMFKHFMLNNQNNNLLARSGSSLVGSSTPNTSSEWQISATDNSGQFRFNLTSGSANISNVVLENRASCVAQAEMEINIVADVNVLKGDVNAPVRGFVDAHTHINSNEFFGGDFVHGEPYHRFGVTRALNDSAEIHGANGESDLIGNIFAAGDINFRYDTRGWPDFPYWPNKDALSHTGYYYKWIERAYLSGLRMMTSHMVENKVLCVAHTTINPLAGTTSNNSCEAMDSVRLQVQRLHDLQDYIDAQHGGPGEGFMRIVKSPAEARQVIADGKMAVLMGIEVSELFDCGVQGGCTRATVEQSLQEFYDLGIRSIFPTHRFDNRFAGSEMENGFINVGNYLSADYLFDAEQCQGDTKGTELTPGFPLVGTIPVLGSLLNTIVNAPTYDPNIRYCNQQGLNELGVYLINRMIDMGMLIELDHTSEKTANKILDIVESRNYSGVISAHSHLSTNIDGLHPNFTRVVQAGGYVSPYNFDTDKTAQEIDEYLTEVEATPFLDGVGFSTDMTGLADQAAPRADAQTDPLQYPFTNEFGFSVDQQTSGNRVMDYNIDGVAHYGMLADHVQDLREQAPSRIYESVMNSAEAYLQMWERSVANSNTDYHNSLNLEVRLMNRQNRRCIDVEGQDDGVALLTKVNHDNCGYTDSDQKFVWNSQEGSLRSALDLSLCLDPRNTFRRGRLFLRLCEAADYTKWDYEGYTLFNRANHAFVAHAASATGDNRLLMFTPDNGWDQRWEMRTEREVHEWLNYRTGLGNGCLDTNNGNLTNGTIFIMAACNNTDSQLWMYNPKDGTIRTKANTNKCMDIANGDVSQDTTVVIADCNGGATQQWEYDGRIFTGGIILSRVNRNLVLDVNGTEHGDRIKLWGRHGRQDQRWRTTLQ